MAHRLLGVASTATSAQVKAAYKRLALVHHPDVPTGCQRKFLDLQKATEEMLQRGEAGTSRQQHSQYQHAQASETAEEAAERREWERMREQWRQAHEEEFRDDEESQRRKWHYLKLVVGITGFGALFKIAIFQAVAVARGSSMAAEAALAEAEAGAATSATRRGGAQRAG